MRRALVVAGLSLLLLPAAAGAHAQLEATMPARGASLPSVPERVVFRFSETVSSGLGAVRVFDARGREVQTGSAFHPGTRGDELAVRLRDGLGEGGYTAVYRVLSADSHPVSGGVSFSVGAGGTGPQSVDRLLEGSEAGPITSTAMGVARGVQYAAIAVALGALLFAWLCWRPAPRRSLEVDAAFTGRTAWLVRRAALAGVVSGVLGVLLEGAIGEGRTLWAAARPDVVGAVLGTRFGLAWGVGVLAWLVVAATATALSRGPAGLGVLGPVWLALLPALGGHAASKDPVWLALPANLVHVVAVSAWLGGLVAILVALRAATGRLDPDERAPLLVRVVGRFSTLAGTAVALVLASGIVQSLVNVDAWSQLTGTAYGRAIVIKAGLLALLIGLGAAQRRRVLPALRAASGTPGRAGVLLRRVLRAEVALGVLVLGVTGALATYPPGDAAASGPVSRSTTLGPARVEATVDPATVGTNEIHLYLLDRRTGAQWDRPKEVRATASLAAKDIDALPVGLRKAGPGHYVAPATALPSPGRWRLRIAARVSDFDEYDTTITVPVR